MRNFLIRVLFVVLAVGVLVAPDRWPPADEHAAHAQLDDEAIRALPPPNPAFEMPVLPAANPSRSQALTTGTETFTEDFSDTAPIGNPPIPWVNSVKWDLITHSRDNATWGDTGLERMTQLEGFGIHHGPNCEAPDANPATDFHDGGNDVTKNSMSYTSANFLCRDHLMTALRADGYGLIYQTPTRLLQIPEDGSEAVIRLNISTHRSSTRDWIDLWITPWDDNLVAPFNIAEVDLAGSPRNGLTVRMDNFNNKSDFRSFGTRNGIGTELGTSYWTTIEDKFASICRTPSKSIRDTFELRISKTHIKWWMPDLVNCSGGSSPLVWMDRTFASVPALGYTELPWSQFVIQFGHHSYNPTKPCHDGGRPLTQCPPNTWHWDQFYASPVTAQFTVKHATQRAYTFGSGVAQTITFEGAAPATSWLRMNLNGLNPEISLDGGGSWATLRRQPSTLGDVNPITGHHRPYWHAIPEGTTSVQIRATPSSGNPGVNINYASIWSETTNSDVPPTFTPTATPINTNTPTPTFTPTNTPTPTHTPTSTPTPVPTATPLPDLNIVQDNFDDNSLDGAKWTVGNLYGISTAGMTVAETGQELRVTAADTSSTRADGIHSVQNFNLTGREAYVQVKQVATQAGGNNGMQTAMILGPDASNWFRIVVDNGQLFCTTNTANSEVIRYQASYSSTTHAWWRIRELDGQFFCDTSADDNGSPAGWTNRATFTRPAWPLTGIGIELHVLTYVTVASATPARFDNFNTTGGGGGRPRRGSLTGVE